jgi:TM2 domain-containing membrane protein YozV
MSLLADPRIKHISVVSAAESLGRPRTDIQTAIDALVQAGELDVIGASAAAPRYGVSPERKAELEQMFRDAATDLGETRAIARFHDGETALMLDDEDEPRLPVTAGLLSLFLPGTGQLLNGDVGRASLVFAVWSLALLTHLSPIWTFVALYAGAEAFFTAKIKGLERKLAVEQASNPQTQPSLGSGSGPAPRALGPRGPSEAPST